MVASGGGASESIFFRTQVIIDLSMVSAVRPKSVHSVIMTIHRSSQHISVRRSWGEQKDFQRGVCLIPCSPISSIQATPLRFHLYTSATMPRTLLGDDRYANISTAHEKEWEKPHELRLRFLFSFSSFLCFAAISLSIGTTCPHEMVMKGKKPASHPANFFFQQPLIGL